MQSEQNASQFKDSFIKTHTKLAPLGEPPGSLLSQKSRLQSTALLRPKYICLSCSETCMNSERSAHSEKTGHRFCMQSRVLRSISTRLANEPLNQTWIRELGICTVRAATTSSMTMNWTVFDHQHPMFHSKVCSQQIHIYSKCFGI